MSEAPTPKSRSLTPPRTRGFGMTRAWENKPRATEEKSRVLKTRHYRVSGEGRTEFAGGEGVEGAEAGGQFGGGQAALAVEAAEKIVGGLFSFLGVAFHATRDQVAVGIAPQTRLRHDVVQALRHDEEIQTDPLPNFRKSVRLVHGTRIAPHLATPRTPA